MSDFSHGFFGMGYMAIIPFLIIAFLIYAFRDKTEAEPSAQEILDKRFANGGISKEEYEEKTRYLKRSKEATV